CWQSEKHNASSSQREKSSTTKDTKFHEGKSCAASGASRLQIIKFTFEHLPHSLRPPIFFGLLLDWLPKFVLFPRHFRPWTHVSNSALVTRNHNFCSLENCCAIFGTRSAYPTSP